MKTRQSSPPLTSSVADTLGSSRAANIIAPTTQRVVAQRKLQQVVSDSPRQAAAVRAVAIAPKVASSLIASSIAGAPACLQLVKVDPKQQGARRSSRLKKINDLKIVDFKAPAGAVGHYFTGRELGLKGLYSTRAALNKEIAKRLQADFKKHAKVEEIPDFFHNKVEGYYNNGIKTGNRDFIDLVPETLNSIPDPKDPTSTIAMPPITRPLYTAAFVQPRDGAAKKEGASVPHGGVNSSIDDKGHLAPEKGVSDRSAVKVNGRDNIIAENWVINQKYKTAFEREVKKFATKNPSRSVYTIHVPTYTSSKGDMASYRQRPKSVMHFVAVNGKIISAFTFKNSKRMIEPRPQ